MEIYIFVSVTTPSVRGFTSVMTGDNLPADYAPWRVPSGGNGMLLGSDTDPVARAVQRDGYFLVSTKESAPKGRGIG
jgi:hypothetical protein